MSNPDQDRRGGRFVRLVCVNAHDCCDTVSRPCPLCEPAAKKERR